MSDDYEIYDIDELIKFRDEDNFLYFNHWVQEFFRREVLRETNALDKYEVCPKLGPAMRQEVSYWNPNRSHHAEVYWLEKYVFNRTDVSLRNKVLNSMAVKFVGMPTFTLVAMDSHHYSDIIDFEEYKVNPDFKHFIDNNCNTNRHKLKVWGATQLQTSLQTAARNYCRAKYNDDNRPFHLSDMIEWMCHLDDEGLSNLVMNPDTSLKQVCVWLKQYRGIGPYFSYHPPCNFSRSAEISIDEDENFCLAGPGSTRGLQFVFPNVNFKNNDIKEKFIISVRHHQEDFFDFTNHDKMWYNNNLERNGQLTVFGTEITFCQFNVFRSIKDNPKAQKKRMLPLTFAGFVDISKNIEKKLKQESFFNSICQL